MDDFNKKLKNKIYYLENRKSLIKKQIAYNNKNSEHIKEYQENYRNGNIEHIRKLNRDNMKTKDKTDLMIQRYKKICKKLGLQYRKFNKDTWIEILSYFGECAFCENNDNLVLGFVIPYSKKGNLIYGNVIPCCEFHRKSKHNRLLIEWFQYGIVQKLYPEKVLKLNQYINSKNR